MFPSQTLFRAVRRAIRARAGRTQLKGLPRVALALWGLVAAAGAWPAPGPAPSLSGIEAAALVIFYAFIGFENSVVPAGETADPGRTIPRALIATIVGTAVPYLRSEEHTSELQSLMRISSAVFCLKKK